MVSSEMTPADIAAVTNGNRNSDGMGWGGSWGEWILVFLIFAVFGWGGFGGNGNGFAGRGNSAGGGVTDGYVLASDFANIERKIDGVNNGLCDGFYAINTSFGNLNNTLAQNFAGVQNTLTQGFAGLNTVNIQQGYENRIATQGVQNTVQNCCCDLRAGIADINYNMANQSNAISRQISDCCCGTERQIERGFCDTNYNMATQNCQTLQAIDKVGDRIIDYLANEKAQTLRDENQALRLAASQQAQNNYLISQLSQPCPKPAYLVCNPNAGLNYSVNYSNGGCGGCTGC